MTTPKRKPTAKPRKCACGHNKQSHLDGHECMTYNEDMHRCRCTGYRPRPMPAQGGTP